jgi:hypothetical protein
VKLVKITPEINQQKIRPETLALAIGERLAYFTRSGASCKKPPGVL